MITFIYRSSVKLECYLYLATKDNFDCVPSALLKRFGKPEFSMLVDLSKRSQLARVDIEDVKQQLDEQGYFLQMPPTHSMDHIDGKPGGR